MALLNGPSVPINGERLLQRITELAEIGKIEGTNGCSRLAFSDADREGRGPAGGSRLKLPAGAMTKRVAWNMNEPRSLPSRREDVWRY